MKKTILNKFLLGSLILVSISCTDKYLDINSDPYQPGSLENDDYALGSAMTQLASCVVSSDVNTAQFTDCLLGGPMGGYFADSNKGFSETISNFNAKNDWTRVFLISDKIIPVLYGNLNSVQIVSNNTGNPVPYAIAQIIKVAAMSRVTDTYGPIPYSKIGSDGKITIPYDSQEEVYNKFFEELDNAINVLLENKGALLVSTADYVYGGDVEKWLKFANSLRLRLAMRIAYANPTKAKEIAEACITSEAGLITANVDNAAWNYFGSITNSLFTALRYNAETSGGDTHAAADIICYMNGYNDNRRASYFELASNGEYVGLRRGIDITKDAIANHFVDYSTVKISASDPILWMNAAEVSFLRAEGIAIFGFNMGGSAEEFYNQGIRLSFEQWKADGVDEYLSNSTRIPATYVDPFAGQNYNTKLSTITVKWDEKATKEEKQERIIIQKWIANWILGNEAWADYRRTGYPHLIPATDEGNKSGGIVDSQRGARRMPYPNEEYTSNLENVNYAVANYLKGPDNMSTDVWWACKK